MTEAVTVPTMETLLRMFPGDSGECGEVVQPVNLRWINKKCVVRGEEFQYEAYCLLAFPKRNGTVRYIVEDNGRLFIQRESQITFSKHEDPVTLAVLDDMDTELSRMSSVTVPSKVGTGCPMCGYRHPPDGMCVDDPMGR